MKDLDFDELDKAVNSLMAGVPKTDTTPAPVNPVPDAADAPVADSITPASAATPPTTEVMETPKPVLSTPPLAARRRSGKFMDMVRPSSTPPATTPRSLMRRGTTVNPTTLATTNKVDTGPSESSPSRSPLAITPPTATSTNDWPDPLEMAEPQAAPAANEPPVAPMDTPAMTSPAQDEAPLTTPFLSDAKVEKRPLGALAAELSTTTSAEDVPSDTNYDDSLPAKKEDVASLLPEELHNAVTAIESDATTAAPEALSVPLETEPEKPAASSEPALAPPATEQEPSTGPTSITQQYREEPSTGEQKNGAIFDTNTYHQPLSHPAQKKNGWMWVVWIILILLVGAAGGAALYIFRIIS